jgi:nicotine blue oxidoreductase
VRRLVAAFHAGAEVAVACYEGRPRNPVLIARAHWAEVAEAARGDAGARSFLRSRPDLITAVECGDVGRPDDLDTRDDLVRITGLLAGAAAPTAPPAPGAPPSAAAPGALGAQD